MDDQQNKDLVIDSSGPQDESSTQGVNIQVKTAEPAVNDIQAPPQPEVTIEEKDVDAINTAVQDISDNPTSEAPEEESSTAGAVVVQEQHGEEETQPESEPAEEPAVKEAPASTVESDIQTEEKSESSPDPFMQKPEDASALAAVATTAPQTMSNNEQALPHEHRNNKKFAIIVTIILALLLAVATVYVYVSAQNNASESNRTGAVITPRQQVAEVIPATTADLEQTVTKIDDTMKSIDDDTDLNEAEISDATLGL